MQQPKRSGVKGFLGRPVGKALYIAITILVVFGAYVYIETLVAIPAFLIFGLAVPIWAGLKRPRFLALLGLVVILVVAPVSTLVITEDVRAPIGVACSPTNDTCGANNNALLQNASVSPYTGTTSTNFTWTVTIFPQYLAAGNFSIVNLSLYVSTCPGATGTSPPSWCSAGYPFHQFTQIVDMNRESKATTYTFHYQIGSNGIWDWQMGFYTLNNSTGHTYYGLLVGDPTYNGIEGPVVGSYLTTFGALLPTIYFDDLLFLGGPFYLVLLVYLLIKRREQRRKETAQRAAGPVPPSTGSGPPGEAPPPLAGTTAAAQPVSPSPPSATERTCPNCNAVVYANETKCWKCGADLSSGTALPSSSQ